MEAILSIIASIDHQALGPDDISTAREKLPDAGIPHWLAPRIACDIPFICKPDSINDLLHTLRACFSEKPFDVNIIATAQRRKRLLIADMDSTIIGQECIDELADFAGQRKRVSDITERAMRGELVFEDALRERVALFKGLDSATLEAVFSERIRLNPGAKALVSTMRAQGAYTALVSGGFTHFTGNVARMTGFDMHQSNELIIENAMLTGKVGEPILGREAKLQALEALRARFDLPREATIAVGDGANDLAMIEQAGLGVAYHAKPVVSEKAKARLDHADLTGLLYLQGYHADEIINA